jgi:hypothetical protein
VTGQLPENVYCLKLELCVCIMVKSSCFRALSARLHGASTSFSLVMLAGGQEAEGRRYKWRLCSDGCHTLRMWLMLVVP